MKKLIFAALLLPMLCSCGRAGRVQELESRVDSLETKLYFIRQAAGQGHEEASRFAWQDSLSMGDALEMCDYYFQYILDETEKNNSITR